MIPCGGNTLVIPVSLDHKSLSCYMMGSRNSQYHGPITFSYYFLTSLLSHSKFFQLLSRLKSEKQTKKRSRLMTIFTNEVNKQRREDIVSSSTGPIGQLTDFVHWSGTVRQSSMLDPALAKWELKWSEILSVVDHQVSTEPQIWEQIWSSRLNKTVSMNCSLETWNI